MKKSAAPLRFFFASGIVLLEILFSIQLKAKNPDKYWVTFRDKNGCTFDPYHYFDERTISQRIQNRIPVLDSSDFPVSDAYLSKIAATGAELSLSSRWLNGVALYATPGQVEQIRTMPFVLAIECMFSVASIAADNKRRVNEEQISLLKYQTSRMQGDEFSSHNLDGKGIRIAVFDAGFPGVDKSPVFKKLRDEKRIVATHDFISDKDDVYAHHWHGTATLSCIAGIADSLNMGLATGAEFLLARTEYSLREPASEEEYWLAAAEWADQQGANIISSSLGYTNTRYFNNEMNGRTSLVARAATIAVQKGILVINAAGNEGDNSWRIIDTPADADSVLAVGGTDPASDLHIAFSSFGPTSDGKMKPNVCAPGKAVVAEARGVRTAFGTSFSAPLIAGFAACAWQSHREWTNMELFGEIQKSGHLYPYFDYAHGYGIPQASYFIEKEKNREPTFDFVIVNNEIKVILREKYSYSGDEQAWGYRVKRNLFYKREDRFGRMVSYSVILGEEKEALRFLAEEFN
ncbi:MAG TPA: S8 family serine peptidase, partial [Bacteroidia bacterium]|nr:S8 family serine peptidase [Bacteroidia bacterium]